MTFSRTLTRLPMIALLFCLGCGEDGGETGDGLPSCDHDQVIARDGDAWVCRDPESLPDCSTDQVIVWDGSQWVCETPDNLPDCTTDEIMAWDGSQWVCQEPAPPDEAPQVLTTVPADGATEVSRHEAIAASFSELMDPLSIDEGSFTVTRGGHPIEGAVDGSGPRLATFTPSDPLALLTTYQASISTDATDLDATPLESDVSWSFTTADGQWSDVSAAETTTDRIYEPSLAVNWRGQAVLAWLQFAGALGDIWARTYEPGAGWSIAEQLRQNQTEGAVSPQVAIDEEGRATVVWEQYEGGRSSVMVSRYVPGLAWSQPEFIESSLAGQAYDTRVGMDASGRAHVFWAVEDANVHEIWTSVHHPAGLWDPPEMLFTDAVARDLDVTDVAVAANGDAVVVWDLSPDGIHTDVWLRNLRQGIWAPNRTISDGVNEASTGRAATNPSGSGLVVWQQSGAGASGSDIWASHLDGAGAWGAPQLLSGGSGGAERGRVAMTPSGDAMALWGQTSGPSIEVVAKRYQSGGAWSVAVVVSQSSDTTYDKSLVLDLAGHGFAAWVESAADESDTFIKVSRYVDGAGWQPPHRLYAPVAGSANPPMLGVDYSGSAILAWEHSDGSNGDILHSRFE